MKAIFGKPGLAAFLFAHVLLLSLVELFLLEAKYEVFRGGFLQSHSIIGWRMLLFVGALLLIELCFYGLILAIGAMLTARWEIRRTTLAYHFFWGAGVLSLALIAGRYQLGQYFSDFLDFSIVKNLGGGSAADAFKYVIEEGAVFLFLVGFLVVAYGVGHYLVISPDPLDAPMQLRMHRPRYYARWAVVAASGLVAGIWFVNLDDDFRYNLNRTTAYLLSQKTLDWVTDFDGDGYGFFSWRRDLASFDSSRYPGALDVPDDGIDQDGLFGDFKYVATSAPAYQFSGPQRNVVVIVIESARADALDAMVAGRPVMPHLKEIAKTGSFASRYYSHTGYTTSSLKAIFSGSLVGQGTNESSMFSILKKNGYQIGVYSGQPERFGGVSESINSKGMADSYFDADSAVADRVFPSANPGSLALSNQRVVRELKDTVGHLDKSKPIFIYVNLQSGHFPYHHPGMPQLLGGKPIPRGEISAKNRDWVLRTYYNAMAYADWAVGEIVLTLKQFGIYENTMLVVTGDHGESLFDDGFLGHGHYLNDAQTKTLLVANSKDTQWENSLGQTDLMPWILFLAGAKPAPASGEAGHKVFQFIGNLDQPQAIGLVDEKGIRVELSLANEELRRSPGGGWIPRAQWETDHELRAQAQELVLRWENLRWEQFLAKQRSKDSMQQRLH